MTSACVLRTDMRQTTWPVGTKPPEWILGGGVPMGSSCATMMMPMRAPPSTSPADPSSLSLANHNGT